MLMGYFSTFVILLKPVRAKRSAKNLTGKMIKISFSLLFSCSTGPPTIIKALPFEFRVNYPAVLRCEARGTSLTLFWVSPTGIKINPLHTTKQRRLSDERYETTYTIKKANRQHNGQYKCQAKNEVGAVSENVTLLVLGKETSLEFH